MCVCVCAGVCVCLHSLILHQQTVLWDCCGFSSQLDAVQVHDQLMVLELTYLVLVHFKKNKNKKLLVST